MKILPFQIFTSSLYIFVIICTTVSTQKTSTVDSYKNTGRRPKINSKPRALPASAVKKGVQMMNSLASEQSRTTPPRLVTYNPNKKKGTRYAVPKTTPSTTTTVEDFEYEYDASGDATDVDSTPAVSPEDPSFVMPDNFTTLYKWEAQLFRQLFDEREYSSKARPAIYANTPVNVTLELVLLKINELVEIEQEILISGFIKVLWNDHRLRWNPKDFGGIEWLVSDIGYIWLPDLALINSDDVYAITRDNRFPVRLNYNGSVLFVPAGKISARCELDLSYFPFDEQLCHYRFESWVYTSEFVDLRGVNFSIDRNHYVANPQWSIHGTFVKTRIVKYEQFNFSQVDFYVLLRRKSLFFLTYTVFPSVIISSLQILSHLLPFTESERINFGTTTLIAFSVFHISVVEQVPKSSESIPLLALYVDSLMCLIAFSLVECFLIMNWINRVGVTVPSPLAWYFVVERLGPFLWLGSTGTHWRRQYLRVLYKVRAKEEIQRRKEKQLKKLAASKLTSKKERYQRLSVHFPTLSKMNIRALQSIMDRWGDLASDLLLTNGEILTNIQTTTTPTMSEYSGTMNKKQQRSGSSSSMPMTRNHHEQHQTTCPKYQKQSDPELATSRRAKMNEQIENLEASPIYNRTNVDRHHQRVLFANNFGVPFRQLSDSVGTGPNIPTIRIEEATDVVPPPEFGDDVEEQNQIYESIHESRYATLPGGKHRRDRNGQLSDSFKFFEFADKYATIDGGNNRGGDEDADGYQRLKSSQSDYAVVEKRKLYKEQKRAAREIYKLQTVIDSDRQLKKLQIIAADVEAISANLMSQNLKRECIGVWTVFITSFDRLMSLLLLIMFIVAPIYLFLYMPSTASSVTSKAESIKNSP